jgi:hypothetical protein
MMTDDVQGIAQLCSIKTVMPRESGASSNTPRRDSISGSGDYWIIRFRG